MYNTAFKMQIGHRTILSYHGLHLSRPKKLLRLTFRSQIKRIINVIAFKNFVIIDHDQNNV